MNQNQIDKEFEKAWEISAIDSGDKEHAKWLFTHAANLYGEKMKVAIEALEWIAKQDTASHEPDFLWLCNWLNTRKQAATKALKKILGEV